MKRTARAVRQEAPRRRATARRIAVLGLALLACASSAESGNEDPDSAKELLRADGRLRTGFGSRLEVERGGEWVPLYEEARRRGIEPDFLQLWLTRGWSEDWARHQQLVELARKGVVPVVVHYYYGDDISKERIEAQRKGWYESMWRMANLVRMPYPVLVILEPEWNNAPPKGETAVTDWPWFAKDLTAAAEMIRDIAPNALVGTCPGDFPGPPHLEAVLSEAADNLDFLAFQEMRADTAPEAGTKGYRNVGAASVDFARYLHRAFGRPLLLGYLAFSSHGGWEDAQAKALRGLHQQRRALQEAGVFGWIYFQLFDDPEHVGYFGPAERHFGLLRADGSSKPAFEVFRAFFPKPVSTPAAP